MLIDISYTHTGFEGVLLIYEIKEHPRHAVKISLRGCSNCPGELQVIYPVSLLSVATNEASHLLAHHCSKAFADSLDDYIKTEGFQVSMVWVTLFSRDSMCLLTGYLTIATLWRFTKKKEVFVIPPVHRHGNFTKRV